MLDKLLPIMAAIEAGDKRHARRLLRPMLEDKPTAEVWYLASQVTEKPDHEIACLERALALDPYHGKAKTRLLNLRQGTLAEVMAKPETKSPEPQPKSAPLKQSKPTRGRRGRWNYLGCAGLILLSLSSAYFVMLVLGASLPGQFRALFGADGPVTEIDGTPLAHHPDAIYRVPPSLDEALERSETTAQVLEPGYLHEYNFPAERGEELAIYVQFVSPTAQRVRRNLLVLDADGQDASNRCLRDSIITGNNNLILSCPVHVSGRWKLRILGREGESSGAYFVSIERLGN